jgi:site-specific DNA-methyltransferase (adenine-specific)
VSTVCLSLAALYVFALTLARISEATHYRRASGFVQPSAAANGSGPSRQLLAQPPRRPSAVAELLSLARKQPSPHDYSESQPRQQMTTSRQTDLFGEIEAASVSIDDAATRLGVSAATIRNWQKTGYLRQGSFGGITEESIEHFQDEIAGKEKLTQRANKSLKDSHDHDSVSSAFLSRVGLQNEPPSTLGSRYESSLSDSFRNKEGIYYTPPSVVQELFNAPFCDFEQATFCDPCCGSGNFIVRALELGFKPENIYGYDVDPVAVEITKARIREFCGYESDKIRQEDFLQVSSRIDAPRFDFIYTNPPWGKKLGKEEKESLGSRLKAGSSLDTSSLFFFACLDRLEDRGGLGLLLPEAFFNISTFESARIKALSLSIERLVDFGKPFKGLLTKAQAIVLAKRPPRSTDSVRCENSGSIVARRSSSFSSNPRSILNLGCDQESATTLEHLFSIPHITLAGRAQWGLGIVTGNNKKFIQTTCREGHIPVFKGADISKEELRQPSCFIPSNFDLYQQVAPRHLYGAKSKLIYKFISSRLCFFHDTEQRFVLNSANMLIPNDDFPVSTKPLGELLSSDFMNWVFSSIFNTSKILRGDLEALPIFSQYLADCRAFCESTYLDNLGIQKTPNGTYRVKN